MEEERIIELYLMQNDYNKSIKCSDPTSKLISYKLLRDDLCKQNILSKVQEINNAGVYILIGTNDDKEVAYIGQSLNLLTRIKQSHTDSIQGFWSAVILITTDNNSLNQTSISYIENQLIKDAKTINRYVLTNANETGNGNPTSNEKTTLNTYIKIAKLYIQALGYSIFVPFSSANDEIFYLKHSDNKYNAKGVYNGSNNHFTVLKGSKMADAEPTAATASFVKISRESNSMKYKNFITLADIEFNSPSVAGAFIRGQNTNGLDAWKTKEGITLKKYLKR